MVHQTVATFSAVIHFQSNRRLAIIFMLLCPLLCLLISCNPIEQPDIPKANGKLEELSHQKIQYTKHAKCRMECRHITSNEIVEVLDNGTINSNKSDAHDTPCPTFAVEGISHEGQKIRVVIADCDNVSRVITVIDLVKDWSCNCK